MPISQICSQMKCISNLSMSPTCLSVDTRCGRQGNASPLTQDHDQCIKIMFCQTSPRLKHFFEFPSEMHKAVAIFGSPRGDIRGRDTMAPSSSSAGSSSRIEDDGCEGAPTKGGTVGAPILREFCLSIIFNASFVCVALPVA